MTISKITKDEIWNKFHDLYLTATEKRLDSRISISNGKAELSGKSNKYRLVFHPSYGKIEEVETKTVSESVKIFNSRGYQYCGELTEGIDIYRPIVFKNQELVDKYEEQQRIVKEHNDRIIQALSDLIDAVWEVLKKNGEETYIRFGLIPENGRSFNFRDQTYEDGVSCFKAYKLDDAYIVDVAGGYFTFLGYLKKYAYEITGDDTENTGSDGEPVLRNAEIVKEVSSDLIFDIKSFIVKVFNDF